MIRSLLLLVAISFGLLSLEAQVITIRDARDKNIGTEVTLTGIVTCDVIGNHSTRFFQDATGGMAVYDGSFADAVKMGDSITITGVLAEYQKLLELDPVSTYSVHSSGHDLPDPLQLTPSQLHDSIQGMLVQIKHAVFDTTGSVFIPQTYQYTAVNEKGTIYVHQNNALVGEVIPAYPVSITGILSTYYDNPQLLVRTYEDLVASSSIWLTWLLWNSVGTMPLCAAAVVCRPLMSFCSSKPVAHMRGPNMYRQKLSTSWAEQMPS